VKKEKVEAEYIEGAVEGEAAPTTEMEAMEDGFFGEMMEGDLIAPEDNNAGGKQRHPGRGGVRGLLGGLMSGGRTAMPKITDERRKEISTIIKCIDGPYTKIVQLQLDNAVVKGSAKAADAPHKYGEYVQIELQELCQQAHMPMTGDNIGHICLMIRMVEKTAEWKYWQPITKWAAHGNFILGEDNATVAEAIKKYEKKHAGTDIVGAFNRMHTVNELYDAVGEHAVQVEDEVHFDLSDDDAATDSMSKIATKLIGRTGRYRVYRIDKHEELLKSSCSWCVYGAGTFPNYGPPYFLLTKQLSETQEELIALSDWGNDRNGHRHICLKDKTDRDTTDPNIIGSYHKIFSKSGYLDKLINDYPHLIVDYCMKYLNGKRMYDGEAALLRSKDASAAIQYANRIMQCEWPELTKSLAGRKIDSLSVSDVTSYLKKIDSRKRPDAFDVAISRSGSGKLCASYATEVIHGRWPVEAKDGTRLREIAEKNIVQHGISQEQENYISQHMGAAEMRDYNITKELGNVLRDEQIVEISKKYGMPLNEAVARAVGTQPYPTVVMLWKHAKLKEDKPNPDYDPVLISTVIDGIIQYFDNLSDEEEPDEKVMMAMMTLPKVAPYNEKLTEYAVKYHKVISPKNTGDRPKDTTMEYLKRCIDAGYEPKLDPRLPGKEKFESFVLYNAKDYEDDVGLYAGQCLSSDDAFLAEMESKTLAFIFSKDRRDEQGQLIGHDRSSPTYGMWLAALICDVWKNPRHAYRKILYAEKYIKWRYVDRADGKVRLLRGALTSYMVKCKDILTKPEMDFMIELNAKTNDPVTMLFNARKVWGEQVPLYTETIKAWQRGYEERIRIAEKRLAYYRDADNIRLIYDKAKRRNRATTKDAVNKKCRAQVAKCEAYLNRLKDEYSAKSPAYRAAVKYMSGNVNAPN